MTPPMADHGVNGRILKWEVGSIGNLQLDALYCAQGILRYFATCPRLRSVATNRVVLGSDAFVPTCIEWRLMWMVGMNPSAD